MRKITMPDTRIGSAEFGDYHYSRFLAWAFCDRQSKAALLRNLGAARVDANQELIDRKLQYYCRLYKLTARQLAERIIDADNNNVSIAKLHQMLAEEVGLDPKQVHAVSFFDVEFESK